MTVHLPGIRPTPGKLPVPSDYRNDEVVAEAEIREYGRVLVKYRTLIGSCLAIGVLIALIFSFTTTPLYTASSRVRISTYEPILTATKIEDMLQAKSKETNYLETQLEEMRSFSLADKILEDPKIKELIFGSVEYRSGLFSWLFGRSHDDQDKAMQVGEYKSSLRELSAYLAAIKMKAIKRTSLVEIQATFPSAETAAFVANKHAQTYIEWVRDVRVEQQARGLQFLRAQAEEFRERVADLERELADYAEANSIVALNKDENITVQKMSQLNGLLTQATAKRIEAENIFKEAEAAMANPSAAFDDISTQQLRSELAKLEGEYSELGIKFTPSYPRMRQLKSQIEEMKRAIQGQRRQIVLGLKAKAQASAEEEKRLREELDSQKSQAFELSKRQVQYNVLNRELTSSREMLQNVVRQIKETSLAVESNASNVSIVDYAVVPNSASYPNKKLVLLLGAGLGCLLGIALAFLLDHLDNTVRTPEQLSALLRIPTLGVVPSFGSERDPTKLIAASGAGPSASKPNVTPPSSSPPATTAPNEETAVIYYKEPKSLASEAYRTIRTGILLSQAGEPPRTILVTSAQSSEGKTTSSVNLAACLASAGGRVVLVDADLRRPSVHRQVLFEPTKPGLVEVLTGQASLQEAYVSDLARRVTFIAAGKIPPNPAELLGSLEMASVVDRLSEEFDYVIIDSPPVLPVADSVVLSRFVDGVVLVIKGAMTPRKVVADAKARLEAVGARFLGAVLNDVDIMSGDYYYYNRYYYSYYRDVGKPEGQANLAGGMKT